ncbi:MAG: tRNA dihydrouridine synthase DusB [Oscillospiraceae bacterium]|nr:tRNA dihydrouridine synthase DusB [Oscillospiraceae bacterium]
MQIKSITLPRTAILAPMAGVADRAFREICVSQGAAYVVGEMASSKGMEMGSHKSAELLYVSDTERPAGVQLFGSEPASMAAAAKIAERYSPDVIDINMGCPAPKVTGTGSGSALMKTPKLAGEIIRAVRAATTLPMTVKIRTGWDENALNAVEFALMAQAAGADALTIHGRTRRQMYGPPVNYQMIAAVKKALTIPVIGNGDVADIETAERMYDTGVDLIMAGRGARGAPWLFRILKAYFERGERLPEPDIEEKISIMLEHIRLACQYKGENVGIREARKHVAWYCKGWQGASTLRQRAGSLNRYEELEVLAKEILENQVRGGG